MTGAIDLQFNGAASAIQAVVQELLSSGVGRHWVRRGEGRDYLEHLNAQVRIANPRARVLSAAPACNPLNIGLAVARFFYLISGSNQISDIDCYSHGVEHHSDDALIVPGSAYGSRLYAALGRIDQTQQIENLIRRGENAESRRAVMPVLWPSDIGGESRDVPCLIALNFSPRDGKLHLTSLMRANDALRLMPYNIFELTLFQEFLASQLSLELGGYCHFVTSMHLRREDHDQAKALIADSASKDTEMRRMPVVDRTTRATLVRIERRLRREIVLLEPSNVLDLWDRLSGEIDPYWLDMLGCLLVQGYFIARTRDDFVELLDQMQSAILPPLLRQHVEWTRTRVSVR